MRNRGGAGVRCALPRLRIFSLESLIEGHEGVMDDLQHEAEHSVFMIPRRTKQARLGKLLEWEPQFLRQK